MEVNRSCVECGQSARHWWHRHGTPSPVPVCDDCAHFMALCNKLRAWVDRFIVEGPVVRP
jgi:NAD-dependent SIR2 family protein deacetylase